MESAEQQQQQHQQSMAEFMASLTPTQAAALVAGMTETFLIWTPHAVYECRRTTAQQPEEMFLQLVQVPNLVLIRFLCPT
jgi:hypothetical protein